MTDGAVTQFVAQADFIGTPVTAVSQSVMQVAYAPPATLATRSSLFVAQANYLGEGVTASSQLVVQVAYRVSPTENLNARAWEFTLDGHTFYVIALGEQGTWVYDMTTGQWAEWITDGYTGWNMERGVTWKGDIIAADHENPIIWRLDPTSFIDNDFKNQTRVTTGGIALRGRDMPAHNAMYLTASKGQFDVASTLPATSPTVELEYSDDQGKTFTSAGVVTIEDGNFVQDVQWMSLGSMQAPGRVFRVTDVGAIARIDGADAEVEGED